ncbi:MAG: aldo/keto reductase [Betaproteobacteria bacterium]
MEYRKLGNSGLKVSPLCLGTMMFGDRTDATEAARILGSAFDAGVNFIDTADQYAKGESERITGKLIASNRDYWVLATKGGNAMGPGPNQVGLGRKWIMQAIDLSLKRLGSDYVDVYYLHRYFGLSNFRGWRISEIIRLCRTMNVPQPVVCQPYYNAMNRQPEVEILPACRYYGIGVVPYSPLARGVLTGKYKPNETPPEGTRAGRADKRMMETEFRKESLAIAQKIRAFAEKKGTSAGHFAINWVLNNAIVTSVIGGPRTLEQWQDYLKALEFKFEPKGEALVDSLVSIGHPSTPGYNDPQYPLTGRVPLLS